MTEYEDEYGWDEPETPAPIRYRINGDDRAYLAYRTQNEDGRMLLLLVADQGYQRPMHDSVAMFLDDGRLSVWKDEPPVPTVPLVKVRLILEATDFRRAKTVAVWSLTEGEGLDLLSAPGLYETYLANEGAHIIMQDDELLYRFTVKHTRRGPKVSGLTTHALVPRVTIGGLA